MIRPTRLNLFVGAVIMLAAAVLALTFVLPESRLEWSWWGAVILLIAARIAEAGFVEITRDSDAAGYGISLATVPQLACALLLPPPGMPGRWRKYAAGRVHQPQPGLRVWPSTSPAPC